MIVAERPPIWESVYREAECNRSSTTIGGRRIRSRETMPAQLDAGTQTGKRWKMATSFDCTSRFRFHFNVKSPREMQRERVKDLQCPGVECCHPFIIDARHQTVAQQLYNSDEQQKKCVTSGSGFFTCRDLFFYRSFSERSEKKGEHRTNSCKYGSPLCAIAPCITHCEVQLHSMTMLIK